MTAQFEAFPDPLDNWVVWDLRRDHFAVLGDGFANCLTERKAKAMCNLLNHADPQRTTTNMLAARVRLANREYSGKGAHDPGEFI